MQQNAASAPLTPDDRPDETGANGPHTGEATGGHNDDRLAGGPNESAAWNAPAEATTSDPGVEPAADSPAQGVDAPPVGASAEVEPLVAEVAPEPTVAEVAPEPTVAEDAPEPSADAPEPAVAEATAEAPVAEVAAAATDDDVVPATSGDLAAEASAEGVEVVAAEQPATDQPAAASPADQPADVHAAESSTGSAEVPPFAEVTEGSVSNDLTSPDVLVAEEEPAKAAAETEAIPAAAAAQGDESSHGDQSSHGDESSHGDQPADGPPPRADDTTPPGATQPLAGTTIPSDAATRAVGPPPRPGQGAAPFEGRPPLRRPAAAGQLAREPQAEGFGSGQLVSGTVISVDGNEVVVDLGDRQGVIGRRHLTVDGKTDPTTVVSVGDTIEAAVLVREDPQNRVVLSRTWAAKQRAWQAVDEAQANSTPVRGTVLEAVKGGVVVDIGIRAFLPASQLDVVHVDDLNSFVGQEIEAMVAEADRTTDKIVLSRRALLRQHDRQKAGELLGSLAPGQVRRGRVATVTDFGAFVDLGGVRGLLHLSELSWDRVERTTDVVNVGDEIDVKILSVKGGAKRISLSLRALSPDPLNLLVEGQTLEGVVTRLVDFGAFVRVLDKVEGLVHVSELAEYRVHLPEEVVTPGDELWVKVLRIDRKRRRVDLSVTQAVQY